MPTAPTIESAAYSPRRYRKWEDFGPPPALPEGIPTQEGARAALKRMLLSPAQRKLADRLADLMGERGWCIFSLIAWEKAITMGPRQLRRARADLEQRCIVTYQPFGPEQDSRYLDQPGNGWIWFQPLDCWEVRVEKRGGYRNNSGRPKQDSTSTRRARPSLISDQTPAETNSSNQARAILISAHNQQARADRFDSDAPNTAPMAANPGLKERVDSNQERTNLSSPAGQTCPNTLTVVPLPERADEALLEGRRYTGEEWSSYSLELSDESSREEPPQVAPPFKVAPVLSEEAQEVLERIAQAFPNLEAKEAHLWSVQNELQKLQKEQWRWELGETPWHVRERVKQASDDFYKAAHTVRRVKRWGELIRKGFPVDQAERIVDGKELYEEPIKELAPEQIAEDEQAEDECEREWWPLLTTNEWRCALFGALIDAFYEGRKTSGAEHQQLEKPVSDLLAARIRPEQVALLKWFFEKQPTNERLRRQWYPPRFLAQVLDPFKQWMDQSYNWGEAMPHLKTYRTNKPFGQALEAEAQSRAKRAAKEEAAKGKAAASAGKKAGGRSKTQRKASG
jgi:hypothetical protein